MAALSAQVSAAYATASNEMLLQHYGFVDMQNINNGYTADILDFIEQNVIDQPNEEQLQAVRADAGLTKALTQVPLLSSHAAASAASYHHSLITDVCQAGFSAQRLGMYRRNQLPPCKSVRSCFAALCFHVLRSCLHLCHSYKEEVHTVLPVSQ